jgi:lipoate-protein ligase A
VNARWRTLSTRPLSAAANMAVDAALMDRARDTGESVVRVYTWPLPALSLGRNQTAKGRYDISRLTADSYEIVRRPTGGRALIHFRELTYSITAPAAADEPLRTSYTRLTTLVAGALRRLGVATTSAAPDARTPLPGLSPCFDVPAAGELVVDGRKLVASAQLREDGALLQHGSILIDDDQSKLTSYSYEPLRPVPAPATLRELLGTPPSADALRAALSAEVEATTGERPLPLATADLDPARIRAHVARFRSDDWTWRK